MDELAVGPGDTGTGDTGTGDTGPADTGPCILGARDTELICVANAGADFSRVVDALRRVATITQLLPPRLALARADDGPSPRIRGAVCYRGEIPPEVLSALTSEERLFVTASRERLRQKPRPGDTYPWDAPGFTPPDPPSRPPANRL